MSTILRCSLQKSSCLLSSKFSLSGFHRHVLISARPNSTFSSKKTPLRYGAVISKPQEENSCNPLVVILGWNDCKLKHLEKYSSIFEVKGWSTLCLPAKSFNTFFRSGTKVKKIGIYMAEVIKDQTQKGQPVFLYTFSSGGCVIYLHLTEALTNMAGAHFNSVNVVGSIFDSCPVKPTIESVRRMQVSITEQMTNPLLRSLVWYPVGLVLPLLAKRNPVFLRFFDDLAKITLHCPQLFLYSKADHLVLYNDIEEHILGRKDCGVQVFSKCWYDSPHVQHYMKYPEEYVKLLDEFVTVCLN